NKSILGSLQDGIDVIVEDGVAKLVDRSAFAGSIATANLLVRTFLQNTKASLPEVIKMITVNPARIMKLAHRKGLIESGYDADVVVFDENIDVYLSIVEGYVKYNKLSFSSNES